MVGEGARSASTWALNLRRKCHPTRAAEMLSSREEISIGL